MSQSRDRKLGLKEIELFQQGKNRNSSNANIVTTEKQSQESSPYVRNSIKLGDKKVFSSTDGKSTVTGGLEMARKNYKAY